MRMELIGFCGFLGSDNRGKDVKIMKILGGMRYG